MVQALGGVRGQAGAMKKPARVLLSMPPAMLAAFEAKHGPVVRKVVKSKQSKPPAPTAEELVAKALPAAQREYRFHPERKWRFDFAWPPELLALEIEGRGMGGQMGRHQTVSGVLADCEKYNTALLMGWRVLRFPATHVKPSLAELVALVRQALEQS